MKYLFLLLILSSCSKYTNCDLNSCIIRDGKGYLIKETYENPSSVLLEEYPSASSRSVMPLTACENDLITSEINCKALKDLTGY